LEALMQQTRAPDHIVVVDNATTDGTDEGLRRGFPAVTHVRLGENVGPAGGFAEGMRCALQRGCNWIWMFNDDDEPLPGALETMLETLGSLGPGVAILGSWLQGTEGLAERGALWRWGRPVYWLPRDTSRPYRADLTTFTGALVSSEAVRRVGPPHPGYFMMFEEIEFCLRVRASGAAVYIIPKALVRTDAAGSRSSPPWRGYYQTRNHLLMAREHRSPLEVFWWGVQLVKVLGAILLEKDRKLERLGLRLLGAWHGALGVDGRVVAPVDAKWNRIIGHHRW